MEEGVGRGKNIQAHARRKALLSMAMTVLECKLVKLVFKKKRETHRVGKSWQVVLTAQHLSFVHIPF